MITKKPTYPDDRRIDLTAYMGPRRAGKRLFGGQYAANPRDPKKRYPSFITEEVFELYKASGLNVLMPEGDAYYGQDYVDEGYVENTDFPSSDLYKYMQLAEKTGLEVYPAIEKVFSEMTHKDGPFGGPEKRMIRDFVETVQTYFPNCFKGIMLTDEPSIQPLGRVRKIMEYLRSDEIKAIKPDLKIFSSMLPMHARIGSLDEEYNLPEENGKCKFDEERVKAYENYLTKYAEAIGEFGYDCYPFGRDGWLSPVFYQNLELAAEHGKREHYAISITLQSFRMDTNYNVKTGRGRVIYRQPSYEDVRYQVYSSLAFGVEKIGYFTFWQHYSESTREVFLKAMVNYDASEEKGYRKTEIYDVVKEVYEEILSIDHIFMRYKWKGCKVIRTSRERNIRNVKGGYEGGCLKDMKASRDLLVGCMENPEDNAEGYWIINAQNPYFYEMNEAELQFEGATHVAYYRKGCEYVVPLQDGKFAIRLGVGEGIFAIPYCEKQKGE